MAVKSNSELTNDVNNTIKVNNNKEITPPKDKGLRLDVIDSFLNIKDGGNVVQALTGYSTLLTPTNDKHFTNKKYVDDLFASVPGGLTYQGTWNATTNTPAITSGVGTNGYYYTVSVAGTTSIDGVNDWGIGDWIVFNGTEWQKIDNSEVPVVWGNITGTITAQTDLITYLSSNYVNLGGSYSNPTWITSLNYSKITGGLSTQFVKADGSLDSSTYLISESDTLATVTTRGATTSNVISLTGANVNNLSLASSIKIGGNTSSALSAGAGSLRYSSGLQVSDGTTWNSVLSVSGLTTDYVPKWNGSTFVNSVIQNTSNACVITNNTANGQPEQVGFVNYNNSSSGYASITAINNTTTRGFIASLGSAFSVVSLQNKVNLGSHKDLVITSDAGLVSGGTYRVEFRLGGYDITPQAIFNPQAVSKNTLVLLNSIKIGNNTDTASTAGAGSIRYNSGLQVSDGTTWNSVPTSTNLVGTKAIAESGSAWNGNQNYTDTITVTGASLGDRVVIVVNKEVYDNVLTASTSLSLNAYVSATNTVTVWGRVGAYTTIPASSNWYVTVLK